MFKTVEDTGGNQASHANGKGGRSRALLGQGRSAAKLGPIIDVKTEIRDFSVQFNGHGNAVVSSLDSIWRRSGHDDLLTRAAIALAAPIAGYSLKSEASELLFGINEITGTVMGGSDDVGGKRAVMNFMAFVNCLPDRSDRAKTVVGIANAMLSLVQTSRDTNLMTYMLGSSTKVLTKSLTEYSPELAVRLAAETLPVVAMTLKNPNYIIEILGIYDRDLNTKALLRGREQAPAPEQCREEAPFGFEPPKEVRSN